MSQFDVRVAVARLEFLQRPIRDVLPPLALVLAVAVAREALRAALWKKVRHRLCRQAKVRNLAISLYPYQPVLFLHTGMAR